MAKPLQGEYAPFYHTYISKITTNSVQETILEYAQTILDFVNTLPDEKADFAYAEGKWSVKEVLQHMIDAERVFVYRALTFARKDTTPLPGFDENEWALHSNASSRSLQSLQNEFTALRSSTDILLRSFDAEQLNQKGTANNQSITVNAIGFIIFGHLLHHIEILQERYL